ncbi:MULTISPECIES: DEAD/DEAH box helicase [Xanthomonas]|uniref:ATP-dependent RNA helicase rhlE n=2 Tax=Xanthomonas TaxID=338 RepID=A0A7Z7NIU9_XANCH|nr:MULTISPECIES: DEAD/DEAH box helicase [Xanthomonas]ATS37460.1 DEAD/DEAH box helicase [Xanthomonas citri pv. phaseoli var. fuscans]ATS43729.1 DEAD/DEAH box helicase [Xanthomonas citri pv. phaseoli var. fuscans]ATS45462.1 DEAD/DEAH box helicase [Xanthomonas citri pv. phaseoli var. fuscans]ATS84271.1 DEAD/DEAH box helicase [Xanthomonas citri pv. phaseoli var. fuscans]QWN19133.1 ATP-dependent helicase [Xanthomonas citri]
MSFSDLSLSPQLQPFFDTALAKAGLRTPTPIQQQAIPPMLDGRDLIAMAQTGSGKTLAYALPLLQQRCLAPDTAPRVLGALVLVPTRELAAQVEDTLRQLAAHLPRRLKSVVVTGGSSINPQLLALRGGADIVVATPGRLLDLVEHNALRLSEAATLVLDEADRLLELGFGAELDRILALLPAQRQTVLFSATFPPAIASLAKRRLRDPLRITIDATPEQAPAIAQRAIAVDAGQRTQLLRHLLLEHAWPQLLVFVASRHSAEKVAEKLSKTGIAALPLHGELSQGRRERTLRAFKQADVQVLVATDLAGRGIDIDALPAVLNYDLPRSTVDYTHRIGRTARAGASGVAISFVTADSAQQWRLIEKRQGLRVPTSVIEGFEPTPVEAPASDTAPGAAMRAPNDNGGIKGKRPSKKDKLRAAAQAQADRPH